MYTRRHSPGGSMQRAQRTLPSEYNVTWVGFSARYLKKRCSYGNQTWHSNVLPWV